VSIIWAPKQIQIDELQSRRYHRVYNLGVEFTTIQVYMKHYDFFNICCQEKIISSNFRSEYSVNYLSIMISKKYLHCKVVALDEKLQFSYNFYLNLYKEISFFKKYVFKRRKVCVGYLSTKWLIQFVLVIWALKQFQRKKNLNYKIVDLDESCIFRIRFISMSSQQKKVVPSAAVWINIRDRYSTRGG
jgi:hypothetical protein